MRSRLSYPKTTLIVGVITLSLRMWHIVSNIVYLLDKLAPWNHGSNPSHIRGNHPWWFCWNYSDAMVLLEIAFLSNRHKRDGMYRLYGFHWVSQQKSSLNVECRDNFSPRDGVILNQFPPCYTHAHTHTHTHMYIYIYIYSGSRLIFRTWNRDFPKLSPQNVEYYANLKGYTAAQIIWTWLRIDMHYSQN